MSDATESEREDVAGRLIALSQRVRHRGRTTGASVAAEDRSRVAFDAAASLMRRSNEMLLARARRDAGGEYDHATLAKSFGSLMSRALAPAHLSGESSATHAHRPISESARQANAATVRALSPTREWRRVLTPTGAVVDLRQAQAEWPWQVEADMHVIRPSEPGWSSIVRRGYALPSGLPQGSDPSVPVPPLSEAEASDAWLALCGMPPALYISAAEASGSRKGAAASLGHTRDPAVMMRRLGVVDPWSPAAAQLDAAAAAQAAREADAMTAGSDDAAAGGAGGSATGRAAGGGAPDDGGLPAVDWELAAAPPLDFYRKGAPVTTGALAMPAESVARRVHVAYEAAQSAFRTRELLNTAADREARLVSEVAARRIQHAWRGSRLIARARADLWGRRERVRAAALHRLAAVQDAMVQFCRVLEQVSETKM